MRQYQTHGFGPVFDDHSRILILGSFPSVKSREQSFYYGHPRNRFWKVIAALTGEPVAGATGAGGEPANGPATDGAASQAGGALSTGGASSTVDAPLSGAALIQARRDLVLRHNIALWDSIESCEIEGSSDASIRNIVPVDIARITDHCPIRCIAANGGTAKKYYDRYLHEVTGMDAVQLPSTSPANAAWSLDRLIDTWREALATYL